MNRLTVHKDNFAEVTVVPNLFIDEFMETASDIQNKVYFYLLRLMNCDYSVCISEIGSKFRCSEADVIDAIEYWKEKGLICVDYSDGEICSLHMKFPRPPKKDDNKPGIKVIDEDVDYPIKEITSFSKNDATAQIIYIAESALGKRLTITELTSLMFIFKELHFSVDLIDYLFEHCKQKGKFEMSYVKKVAICWAEANICTTEQAKNRTESYSSNIYTVMKALGRRGEATEAEVKCIQKWYEQYEFSKELILCACEKAVMAVDTHRMEYADKILSKWHESGVSSLEDTSKLDRQYYEEKAKKKKKKNTVPKNSFNTFSQQRDYDFDEIEKNLYEN